MRTFRNWTMACAVAFAVASAIPAAAQSSGGAGGQSGAGQSSGGSHAGWGSGQSGVMGGAGTSGTMGGTAQAGGQGDQGTQVGRDNPQGDLQKFVEKAALSNMAEIQLGQLAQQKAQSSEVKQFAQTMIDAHTKAQSELQQAASAAGLSVPSSLDSKQQKIQDKLSKLSGAEFDKQYTKVMVDAHNDARKLLEKRAGKSNSSASNRTGSDIGGTAGTSGVEGTSGATGTSGTTGSTAGASGTTGTSSASGSGTETGSTATGGAASASGSPAGIDSWAAATLPDVEHHLQMAKDLEKQLKDEGKSSKSDKTGR